MSPMSERRASWRDMGPLLMEKRIIVCVGAGGVGKTTLAAAMALRAARAGRRVACLTIDPARRLADSLGVADEGRDARLMDITEVLGQDVREGGFLSFGMLDPVETFNRFVHERASDSRRAEQILENKLYRYVSGSLSGMQEYMALEKLSELASDENIDLIVLDTPPTATAMDFFTAPRRMMEALDGPLVRMMRRAYGGPGRIGFDIIGRWAQIVLRAVSRITGADLLGEIMGFVDALSDLFGSFSDRAMTVEKVLHGDDVAFCLITTPDRATFRETREFYRKLGEIGIAVNSLIFNRAHWPEAGEPPEALPKETREIVRALNSRWNEAYEREKRLVDRVSEAWVALDTVGAVPILPCGAGRIESLDRIASYL